MKTPVRLPCLVILFAALVSVGCTHSSLRSARSGPSTLPPEIASDYAYAKETSFDAKEKVIDEASKYVVRRVQLKPPGESADSKRRITVELFQVRSAEKSPVVMVLPMSGGGYGVERHFASYFAGRGYSAAIVHRDKIPKDQQMIENLDPMIHRMILDHKRVIDWIETQSGLDGSRVGVFGISMGGIKGAMLAPLENRIRGAILGLAGGDIPHILAHSTEPGLVKKRQEFLKERNLSPDQAEAELRKIIKRDPLVYAPYVDPKKVMLIIARSDDVVPTAKGLELKERMGNPETIMLPGGHYTAVLSIPYIKSQSFEFLEKCFAPGSAVAKTKSAGGLSRVNAGKR
ncbi:MAG: alpha/beta hydrolase [Verrucomicrobia bacterium]|nr:alpha/beta hydrolase [Verrucomicrobiota bacterium]